MKTLVCAMLMGLVAPLAAQQLPYSVTSVKHATISITPISVTSSRARLLVTLAVNPGWHVSWRNPGETGLPTRLSWSLPLGVRVVRETWPVPVIAHTSVGATHTLEGVVPWIVEIALDRPIVDGEMLVYLTMKYGVCRDVCIPEDQKERGFIPARLSARQGVVSAGLQSRLAFDGGAIAARRRSPTELCLDRVPLTATAPWPEVIADSGLALDAALKLVPASGARNHGFVMNVPGDVTLGDGAKILVVQGKTGVAAHLDFRRPAPGCTAR